MPANSKTLVVFDVCDTLYKENTTFGFIRFLHKDNLVFHVVDTVFSRRWSPIYVLLAVLYRMTGCDIARHAIVAWLRGWDPDRLRYEANCYVKALLADRVVVETHRRLHGHKADGDRVILVSASLDVVVAAIAAQLGVDWRATSLEFSGGRCTGRIGYDLTGRKADVAETLQVEGAERTRLVVYTDNLSDCDLVKAADEAVIVLPRGRNREVWRGIQAEYMQL